MAKVFASVGGAFGYATNNTFKKPLVWILVALVMVLEFIAAAVGVLYLAVAIIGAELASAITGVITTLGLGPLLALFPAYNGGALIAIGVIGLIVSIILGLFLLGLQIKIYAGKDITFSGFFGTVGRGFQNLIISIIYEIVVVILIVAISLGMGQITAFASGDPFATLVALGAWAILLVILAIIFAIFMIPALINFSRQGKFGAAFQFKKIGAMIGAAKWYKILAGIIVIAVVVCVLYLIAYLIAGLLGIIPGIAGAILATVWLVLTYTYIFFVGTSYWAKFFAPVE
ncbi:MAG TPA: DUF4013 domain-containing protein [Methanocorpusculum sp.]|nr:DUF4013 domain-containing protein [Methanocorpusculum sp.]